MIMLQHALSMRKCFQGFDGFLQKCSVTVNHGEYECHPPSNTIRKARRKGKVQFMLSMIQNAVAEMDTPQVSPQVSPQVTPQVEKLLSVLAKGPASGMTREELQAVLSLKDRKSFRQIYLLPALQAGFIEMSLPEKPNSRLQKRRLAFICATLDLSCVAR